jgi:hypothetical protein
MPRGGEEVDADEEEAEKEDGEIDEIMTMLVTLSAHGQSRQVAAYGEAAAGAESEADAHAAPDTCAAGGC